MCVTSWGSEGGARRVARVRPTLPQPVFGGKVRHGDVVGLPRNRRDHSPIQRHPDERPPGQPTQQAVVVAAATPQAAAGGLFAALG